MTLVMRKANTFFFLFSINQDIKSGKHFPVRFKKSINICIMYRPLDFFCGDNIIIMHKGKTRFAYLRISIGLPTVCVSHQAKGLSLGPRGSPALGYLWQTRQYHQQIQSSLTTVGGRKEGQFIQLINVGLIDN